MIEQTALVARSCARTEGAELMTPEVLVEFKRRGYDPTTLKMSIEPEAGNERFASQRPAASPD